MRKSAEWQKFERTGRIEDYLVYAGVKAGENTAVSEGKDKNFVYAGYHHGDGNGSEGRTDGRI